MVTSLGPRIVIIGNSGSGKSTLAKSLSAGIGGELIDLDRIHWQDKVGSKRDESQATAMVASLAGKPRWIIEGVFGWLAGVAVPAATSLIWLDMPWNVCRDSLAIRGPWRGASADEHADFLVWAQDYWRRTTPSSFTGHLALFTNYHGAKWRFRSRPELAEVFRIDLGSPPRADPGAPR